jgi:hypothetical protein
MSPFSFPFCSFLFLSPSFFPSFFLSSFLPLSFFLSSSFFLSYFLPILLSSFLSFSLFLLFFPLSLYLTLTLDLLKKHIEAQSQLILEQHEQLREHIKKAQEQDYQINALWESIRGGSSPSIKAPTPGAGGSAPNSPTGRPGTRRASRQAAQPIFGSSSEPLNGIFSTPRRIMASRSTTVAELLNSSDSSTTIVEDEDASEPDSKEKQ